MSESQHYEGFVWIKVKRAATVEFNGTKYVSEQHHVEETTFLIEEVRRLAKRIDTLNAKIMKSKDAPG